VALFFKDFFRFFRERGKPQTGAREPVGVERLVFGIGNTGSAYATTRHNVGFMVIDRCLSRCQNIRKNNDRHADVAVGDFSGKKVAFVKPTTFVNQCGTAFKSSVDVFGVSLGSCIVVVDDYNLSLGTIRFRPHGSDGGHNGLKSIIDSVGREFPRLRIGIGPLPQGASPVDFVLGAFTPEDEKVLMPVLDRVVEGVSVFLNDGIERAMSAFNGPLSGPGL
jgi:peptidyl-tRNA hydrolase, PTH1 family